MTEHKYMIYKNDIGFTVYKRCKIEGEDAERPIISQAATILVHAKQRLKSENMNVFPVPDTLKLRVGLVEQYKKYEENGNSNLAEVTQREVNRIIRNEDMMTQNIVGLVSQHLQQTEEGDSLEYKSEEIKDFAQYCYNEVSVDLPELIRAADGQKDLDEYMEEE